MCMGRFVPITRPTRQPQIVYFTASSGYFGNDVVNLQGVIGQSLRCQAIAATIA